MLSACCLTRLANLCFILNKGCNILLAKEAFDWSVSPSISTGRESEQNLCVIDVCKVKKLGLAITPLVHSVECPLWG